MDQVLHNYIKIQKNSITGDAASKILAYTAP